jgi:cation diffusion facilitator CzcD-associated flavoprotein CzcO
MVDHSKAPFRAAIIGAGYSGVAAAVALERAGIDYTIFEKSTSIGGTWWDNRYPGAEVDTPSVLYSFSYAPRQWTRTHVQRDELVTYIQDVAESFGVTPHVRLSTEVLSASWSSSDDGYALELADGTVESFTAVISATGLLNVPKYPTWPGMDLFPGPMFHTARWPEGFDPRGTTVAVVGSGSTAAQVVPALADLGARVVMFQREPGWLLPKGGRPFTAVEHAALRSRAAQRVARTLMLLRRERAQHRNTALRPGTLANAAAESGARRYIETVFADRPELARAVTPSYPYGGKRPMLADGLYPALLRPEVELVPRAVEGVTPSGVVDTDGVEHAVDAIVMGTGFTAEFGTTFVVRGPDGRTLLETWDGEPTSLLGIMTPGFPNYFMMYGPNTNGGAIVTHFEIQAAYIARALRRLRTSRRRWVAVKPAAVDRFQRWIDDRLAGTSFEVASNYYKSPSGRIITQWTDGAIMYGLMARRWGPRTWMLGPALDEAPAHPRTPRSSLGRLIADVRVLNQADAGSMFDKNRMASSGGKG